MSEIEIFTYLIDNMIYLLEMEVGSNNVMREFTVCLLSNANK